MIGQFWLYNHHLFQMFVLTKIQSLKKKNIFNSANSLIKNRFSGNYIILSMLKFSQNIFFSIKCFGGRK
jgi:hypothetical protein